jgi:hypothetical protein
MGMTPPAFFETFVRGNRDDCEANRGCARRAFNAAVAASHLADHYFQFSRMHDPALVAAYTTLGEFVEHLVKETNGAFRDIRSISNAYKHLYEDPRMAVYSSISSTGAIQVIEFDDESELNESDGVTPAPAWLSLEPRAGKA